MKSIKTLLLVAMSISILFSACKKDKDLTGTYKVTKLSETNCPDATVEITFDASVNNGCVEELGTLFCDEYIMTFTSEGTMTFTFIAKEDGIETFNISSPGTYTISGDEIMLCQTGEACIDGTFTLSDSGLLSISGAESGSTCISNIEAQRQ